MFIAKKETSSYKRECSMKSEIQIFVYNMKDALSGKLSSLPGESLLTLFQNSDFMPDFACGGKGICGKCAVRFRTGAPLPKAADRRFFDAAQLRAGWRLACMASVVSDCEIEILPLEDKMTIVSSAFAGQEKNKNEEDVKIIPDAAVETAVGTTITAAAVGTTIAIVDIGTTTLAMELREVRTGKVLDQFLAVNPQRVYGSDVLSRMEASMDGKREELKMLIQHKLSEGIRAMESKLNITPELLVVAGNTTMNHLLLGRDVSRLAVAPFVPETLQEEETQLAGIRSVVMPAMSAFVGGDIVADLLALTSHTNYVNQNRTFFLVDLGTNAEMVLVNNGCAYAAAAAAGPAFDGAAAQGFFGADLVRETAALLTGGMLDETGLMAEPYFTEGIQVGAEEFGAWKLTQENVRALQLAKAAVYTGMETLLQKAGISWEEVDQIYLAGGFGYFLDVDSAVKIGMLPGKMKGKIISCGNLVLDGAFHYGKRLLNDCTRELPFEVSQLNLASEDYFRENYMRNMNLEEI